MEFKGSDASGGRYAKIRVWPHPRDREAFGTELNPLLRVTSDPRAADLELRTSSIEEFLARTHDLADIKAKIAELKKTVGPAVAAEDDAGDCSGEGMTAVPVEVR